MPSNYTSNYNLNQWEAEDKVLRTDFNADNAKIDAALAGKANQSALSALQTAVDKKADKSALTTLQNTVSSQGSSVALRNCKVVYGTYTGADVCGQAKPNVLTFSHKPVFLYVACGNNARRFEISRGQFKTWTGVVNLTVQQNFTWGSKSVSWYATADNTVKPYDQLNDPDSTYYYFAILELDS